MEDDSAMASPLIFISHDSRDSAIAEAFSKLLSSVTAGMLKSFRSSDKKGIQGFEYGVEWYPELMKKLEAACDVVCLLTEGSLGRPWLLYEAGVAKGKLGTTVHGLALGVPLSKASAGPFHQFQNCDGSVESVTKLVMQLIGRLPNADPDQETVKQQVEQFVSRVEGVLAKPSPNQDSVDFSEASTSKLFEEIKLMFQDLPSRLEHIAAQPGRDPRLRGYRFHPEMIEELIMMMSRRGEPPVGTAALIYGSFFREDMPWLYEMGVEAYRASMAEDAAAEKRCMSSFIRAVETMAMGPLSREFRGGKELHMILRHLPMRLERYAQSPEPANAESN